MDSRDDDLDLTALALVPEVEARALLRGRPLALRVLRPAFPALGVGVLRVLRASISAGTIELVVGYERYERMDRRPA